MSVQVSESSHKAVLESASEHTDTRSRITEGLAESSGAKGAAPSEPKVSGVTKTDHDISDDLQILREGIRALQQHIGRIWELAEHLHERVAAAEVSADSLHHALTVAEEQVHEHVPSGVAGRSRSGK
jgi:hypothetical protein